jgi:hypothetical protein
MLRDGIIKVLRGGVTGAEKLANAAFRGTRHGIDWLEKRGGQKHEADEGGGAAAEDAADHVPADSV